MCPVASVSSNLSWVLMALGISLGLFSFLKFGIMLFAITILFQIVTIPVEYDASNRAVNILEYSGLVSNEELSDVKKTLNAAALTYVASTAVAISEFIKYAYFLNRGNEQKRKYSKF